MRRLILIPALALVVMAPTGVQAAADDLVVCNLPPSGTTVLSPNDTRTPSVAAPQFDPEDFTFTDVQFQLDLYPASAMDEATLKVELGWELTFNDWDLFLLDEGGNEIDSSQAEQFGPLAEAPGEEITATLKHCAVFTVSIMNFRAVALDEVDPLQLEVKSGPVVEA